LKLFCHFLIIHRNIPNSTSCAFTAVFLIFQNSRSCGRLRGYSELNFKLSSPFSNYLLVIRYPKFFLCSLLFFFVFQYLLLYDDELGIVLFQLFKNLLLPSILDELSNFLFDFVSYLLMQFVFCMMFNQHLLFSLLLFKSSQVLLDNNCDIMLFLFLLFGHLNLFLLYINLFDYLLLFLFDFLNVFLSVFDFLIWTTPIQIILCIRICLLFLIFFNFCIIVLYSLLKNDIIFLLFILEFFLEFFSLLFSFMLFMFNFDVDFNIFFEFFNTSLSDPFDFDIILVPFIKLFLHFLQLSIVLLL